MKSNQHPVFPPAIERFKTEEQISTSQCHVWLDWTLHAEISVEPPSLKFSIHRALSALRTKRIDIVY